MFAFGGPNVHEIKINSLTIDSYKLMADYYKYPENRADILGKLKIIRDELRNF